MKLTYEDLKEGMRIKVSNLSGIHGLYMVLTDLEDSHEDDDEDCYTVEGKVLTYAMQWDDLDLSKLHGYTRDQIMTVHIPEENRVGGLR